MTDTWIHLFAALLLGASVGIERQIHHHEAGLRTNTLVSLGSALYVMMGMAFSPEGSSRVAAQVLTGIGFLGGGVIMRDGLHVRGLTTAATLWCTAAIGTLCGAGRYAEAITGAATILLVNVVVKRFSLRLGEETPPWTAIRCKLSFVVGTPDRESRLLTSLSEQAAAAGFRLSSYRSGLVSTMQFESTNIDARFEPALEWLRQQPDVRQIEWERIL